MPVNLQNKNIQSQSLLAQIMSMNTSFVEKEWLGLGKQWADLPPRIKRQATQDFTIPTYTEEQILPAPNISIHQLTDFPLPTATVIVQEKPSEFFSRYDADIVSEAMLTKIRRLPMPTRTVVKKLMHIRHQAWLDGFKSVKYAHISTSVSTHCPWWVISFWNEVHDLRTTVRGPWLTAKAWLAAELRQKRSPQRRAHAEDVSILLAALPWGGKKCGLSDDEPIHTLWRYLGPHFTTGSQQNDMLEILRTKVAADPHLVQRLRIEGMAFTEKLRQAFATRGTEAYKTEQRFAWLRTIGEDLVETGRTLLTIAHLGDNNKHWVGLVVDAEAHVIQYGDALGSPILPDLLEAYEWWILQHTASPFQTKELQITKQEDSSSCGILADNAVGHFALPGAFPLMKASEACSIGRMSTFIRVANYILERVSTYR
jgi:hypothetical protein